MKSQKQQLVAYLRVSTAEQGLSGLGLEAQRAAIKRYADLMEIGIAAEFVEVQSSRKDRPIFTEALELCAQMGYTLAVARLDRLSRDLHTITTLQKSGVRFVSVDMPGAEKMVIQMMGVIAEYERDTTAARTKAALAAAKARGVRLGAPDPLKPFAPHIFARSKAAEEFRARHRPAILEMRRNGLTLQQIADQLTIDEVPTASGSGTWNAKLISRILDVPIGLNLGEDTSLLSPANDENPAPQVLIAGSKTSK
jgi:DNA invertase Pin-like site-specific DNA recombinase